MVPETTRVWLSSLFLKLRYRTPLTAKTIRSSKGISVLEIRLIGFS
jgi:hypothetical protein